MNRPEYIDCHAHLNFPDYDQDRDQVIKNTKEQDTWVINIGTNQKTSGEVVELAKNDGMYSIIGTHPTEKEEFDEEFFRGLNNEKVVGVGEVGLDYFRLDDKDRQQELFIKHIEFANSINKPLMLHIRPSREGMESYKDSLKILKQYAKVPGNAHFFAGSKEDAKGFLDLGYNISFTGVITFTSDYDELVKYVPLESILSETDSPFVSPAPHRGKRNEPLYVKEVVQSLSRIKGMELEEVKEKVVENAFGFFNLT